MEAPILKIVDPEKDCIVWMDVCKEGLGGILTQEGHVIYYKSIKLKKHKRTMLRMTWN